MVHIVPSPPEPSAALGDPGVLLAEYLDFYRDAALRKLDGLSDQQLRHSEVPSGWAPLELLKHLGYVEQRWLQWGFAAEAIEDPWGDHGSDERWQIGADEAVDDVTDFFRDQCALSRAIISGRGLAEPAATGGRFPRDEQPPTLAWILFHVLQEYARHLGHLDIAREIADGAVGE